MPVSYEIVHTCAYIQDTNPYEVLTTSNILHLEAIFLLHIYDPISILYLVVIFVSCYCL